MGAPSEQAYLQAVRRGGDRPRASGDVPGAPDHQVLPQHHVGLGESLEEVVVDHGARALRRLLAGLEDHHQGAVPRAASAERRAAAPASHVTCMSWPHMCETGRVFPAPSFAVTLLA